MVVFGSEVNSNPSCGDGVKGGFVAGVLTLTSMGASMFWMKFPRNVLPLLNVQSLVTPLHRIRSDRTKALTNPSGCNVFKLLATVNASKTSHTLSKLRTAVAASKSTSTLSSGIGMVQNSRAGEIPGSYECGPNGLTVMLSIHIKANVPWWIF
jgi:hypothetical protein